MEELKAILEDDVKLTEATKDVFDEVDVDHSGLIDKSELRKAMRHIARDAGMDPPTDQHVEKIFKELDIDESGTIDVNEFKVFVRQIIEALANQIIS